MPVYPQQDDPTHGSLVPTDWQDAGDNVLTTRRLPVGRIYVRLAHAAPDGTVYFSETRLLPAVAGQTYTLDLELRPGVRVEGRLDATVPHVRLRIPAARQAGDHRPLRRFHLGQPAGRAIQRLDPLSPAL